MVTKKSLKKNAKPASKGPGGTSRGEKIQRGVLGPVRGALFTAKVACYGKEAPKVGRTRSQKEIIQGEINRHQVGWGAKTRPVEWLREKNKGKNWVTKR